MKTQSVTKMLSPPSTVVDEDQDNDDEIHSIKKYDDGVEVDDDAGVDELPPPFGADDNVNANINDSLAVVGGGLEKEIVYEKGDDADDHLLGCGKVSVLGRSLAHAAERCERALQQAEKDTISYIHDIQGIGEGFVRCVEDSADKFVAFGDQEYSVSRLRGDLEDVLGIAMEHTKTSLALSTDRLQVNLRRRVLDDLRDSFGDFDTSKDVHRIVLSEFQHPIDTCIEKEVTPMIDKHIRGKLGGSVVVETQSERGEQGGGGSQRGDGHHQAVAPSLVSTSTVHHHCHSSSSPEQQLKPPPAWSTTSAAPWWANEATMTNVVSREMQSLIEGINRKRHEMNRRLLELSRVKEEEYIEESNKVRELQESNSSKRSQENVTIRAEIENAKSLLAQQREGTHFLREHLNSQMRLQADQEIQTRKAEQELELRQRKFQQLQQEKLLELQLQRQQGREEEEEEVAAADRGKIHGQQQLEAFPSSSSPSSKKGIAAKKAPQEEKGEGEQKTPSHHRPQPQQCLLPTTTTTIATRAAAAAVTRSPTGEKRGGGGSGNQREAHAATSAEGKKTQKQRGGGGKSDDVWKRSGGIQITDVSLEAFQELQKMMITDSTGVTGMGAAMTTTSTTSSRPSDAPNVLPLEAVKAHLRRSISTAAAAAAGKKLRGSQQLGGQSAAAAAATRGEGGRASFHRSPPSPPRRRDELTTATISSTHQPQQQQGFHRHNAFTALKDVVDDWGQEGEERSPPHNATTTKTTKRNEKGGEALSSSSSVTTGRQPNTVKTATTTTTSRGGGGSKRLLTKGSLPPAASTTPSLSMRKEKKKGVVQSMSSTGGGGGGYAEDETLVLADLRQLRREKGLY